LRAVFVGIDFWFNENGAEMRGKLYDLERKKSKNECVGFALKALYF